MRDYFIFVSESTIGTHSEIPKEQEISLYEMRIPVNVKQSEHNKNSYINNSTLDKNSTFIQILDDYRKYKSENYNIYFLIGFDSDIQGEYMASVLRDELIKNNIPESVIFRMPFVGDKYVAIQDFLSIQPYLDYKGLEADFMALIKRYNKKHGTKLPLMSFKKLLALKSIGELRDKEFGVENNEANSTFTYIVNKLNNNKTSRGSSNKWVTKII